MLAVFVAVTIFTNGCFAQNLVGPEPQNQAFLNGTTHTFQCRLSEGGSVGTISWVEILPGSSKVIYFGEIKSNSPKYENFDLDTDGTSQWDLVINDVEIEDGGTYDCGNDQPAESHRVVAEVEDPPEITYLKYGDSKVVCRTDANPPVMEYVIILNNTDVRRDTQCSGNECEYDLEISYITDIRCNATNDIGTGTKETQGEPGAIIPRSTTPRPTNTETPKLQDVDLSFNVSAVCTPIPLDDDANVVITVDGSPVAKDTELILPSTGCLIIECIVTKGSLTKTKKSKVCSDVDVAPSVSIAAVAVPLALLATAAIVFAIIVILRSRQVEETPGGDADFSGKNTGSGTTETSKPQTYMELDARTREKETAYQEPQPRLDSTSSTYEDVAEGVKSKDRVYQEIGNNSKNDEQLKEYVNVQPNNKAKQGRRK